MERSVKKKSSVNFLNSKEHFINSPRDFFLLSLSFGVGLIFFSIFVYIMIKIMSLDFMSNNDTKDSFEGEGENLDTLDDLLQDEEELENSKEELENSKEDLENSKEEINSDDNDKKL